MLAPDNFLFLNEQGRLSTLGWNGEERSKLWRYNQHYFDDLNATGAKDRNAWHLELIKDWIAANPPGKGTGWEPYPTSLRIVNWIKWATASGALTPQMQSSLAIQTRWLTRRIEWHLLGNHLFANAKALIFAGIFFSGREADGWLEKGLQILQPQISEQFLDDGGHFELSTMYHALAVEDVLDLINILRAAGCRANSTTGEMLVTLTKLVPKMMRWLQVMSHSDGAIALFNDAAFDIAANNTELLEYAARLGFVPEENLLEGITWLEASGYVRLANSAAVVLADMAKIGPDYLPGHAHADTLTFEMSLGQQRLLVNGGTSVYGTGDERLRQRGTAAHNTVEVSGTNSSDVWSGFRVGRRAYPQAPLVKSIEDALLAEAGHNGYRHLHRNLVHRRQWRLEAGRLIVTDTLTRPVVDAFVRFHLHPDITASAEAAGRVALQLPDGRSVRVWANGLDIDVVASTWNSRFGVSLPSRCLIAQLRDGRSCFEFVWD
jgi:uncharacterized heparinase superfamily protein